MVAGDEGQVVELVVGGEAVAPGLVFRGDDEGAGGQPLACPRTCSVIPAKTRMA
jgi:hypothetical protein